MSRHRSINGGSPTPTKSFLPRIVPALGALAATLAVSTTSLADQIGPYATRTLTLGQGTIRIDGGPPDFGYFHPGAPHWLNENRGFRLRRVPDQDVAAWLGLGIAGGITDDIEVGGLALPLQLGPEFDVDDLEAYGRFRFLEGSFEMAFQATLQFPAETVFGVGLGLPMLAHIGNGFRIDTGFEFETLFGENNTALALDVPAAFTWNLGPSGFMGLRTGMFVGDLLDDQDGNDPATLTIPAGFHGGGVIGRGTVDLTGWFMWPYWLQTEREEPFEFEVFELGFGVNGRIP